MRRPLLAFLGALLAVAAVVAIGLSWKDRADTICREKAPATADGYSVRWNWADFAYVCDYEAQAAKPRRVSIIDAFHGEEERRHGR